MKFFTPLAALAWLVATLMSFTYPQTEHNIGAVQRLFYIHFGTFYSAFWLLLLGVICGAIYLKTRAARWDILGQACLEVGLWFLSVTIITGMFIARPIWGVFWTWDSRLISVAIMWLTYMAYFFLRSGIEELDLRRRFAAVYAILAFAAVILSLLSLRIGTNLTSPVLDFTSLSLGMSPRIGLTIWVNIGAYSLVGLSLVGFLAQIRGQHAALHQEKLALLERH